MVTALTLGHSNPPIGLGVVSFTWETGDVRKNDGAPEFRRCFSSRKEEDYGL